MKAPVEETESKNHSFPKGLLFKRHPRIFQNSFETFFFKAGTFQSDCWPIVVVLRFTNAALPMRCGDVVCITSSVFGKNISQPTHYSLLRLKEKRIITVKHLANISGGGTKYHIKATLSMGCRPGLATDASQEPPVTLLIAMKRKKWKGIHQGRGMVILMQWVRRRAPGCCFVPPSSPGSTITEKQKRARVHVWLSSVKVRLKPMLYK